MKNVSFKKDESDPVQSVADYMYSSLNEKAYARLCRAAKRRHLTVDEYLRRTAANVLRYGTTRRYYYCSQD